MKHDAKTCALLLHKILHWFGASVDALMLDPSDLISIFGGAEVKCPTSCDRPIDWGVNAKNKTSKLVPRLGEKTDFYRQVQWQLGILRSWTAKEILGMLGIDFAAVVSAAGKDPAAYESATFDWIDCVVSCIDNETGLVKETHVERVYFNQAWWNENSKKVQRIYLNAFLPELACPRRVDRKGDVRNFVLNKGRQEGSGAEEKWVPEWELDGGLHLKKGGSAPGPGELTPAQENACEHGRWGYLCKECKAS